MTSFLFVTLHVVVLRVSFGCTSTDECTYNEFCDPNSDTCVEPDGTVFCGSYGQFMDCNSTGLITGECGSGSDADCSGGQCPSYTWEGILCDYPDAVPKNGFVDETNWICGSYGVDLSCKTYNGSILTGV